jgi:hypothetical protein
MVERHAMVETLLQFGARVNVGGVCPPREVGYRDRGLSANSGGSIREELANLPVNFPVWVLWFHLLFRVSHKIMQTVRGGYGFGTLTQSAKVQIPRPYRPLRKSRMDGIG